MVTIGQDTGDIFCSDSPRFYIVVRNLGNSHYIPPASCFECVGTALWVESVKAVPSLSCCDKYNGSDVYVGNKSYP